jgi:hypothetical protein
MRGFKAKGMWLGIWGPRPGEPGCQVPASLVERVH